MAQRRPSSVRRWSWTVVATPPNRAEHACSSSRVVKSIANGESPLRTKRKYLQPAGRDRTAGNRLSVQ